MREVAEETGIEIEVTGVAGLYTGPGHIIAYDNGPGTDPVVLQEFSITLHSRCIGGAARADGTETVQVRWVDPGELTGIDLHPVMRRRIADVLDHKTT